MIHTLFKRTNNSLLIWETYIHNKTVYIEHGQHNGLKQTDTHVCSSPEEAVVEMDRRVHIKTTKQGYTYGIPESVPRLPMLAQTYNPSLLPDVVLLQPKLDGMRCVASSTTMQSRRNEPIVSMPHIAQELSRLPPGVILDGELYCHGLSFQEQISLIKRGKTHPDYYKIKYHVFDCQMEGDTDTRLDFLLDLFTDLKFSYVQRVHTTQCLKDHVPSIAKELYSNYEGVILRNPDSPYEYNTRTPHLQKYKWSETEEFQIIDVVCSKTGREKDLAIFVCQLPNGETFKARPKGDQRTRKMWYQFKEMCVGKYTRVTFNGYSNTQVPLKPIAEGLFNSPAEAN